MPNTPDYSWPPMNERRLMGKPLKRVDGIAKATGRAKYNSDVNPEGLLFGAFLTSPHAHARVTSIDTSEAEKLPGVTAVRVIVGAGKEIQWEGAEVAAVAATTEEVALDGVRRIKVEYEPLPYLVREDDLSKAGSRAKPAGEQTTGDPDKGFQEAEVVHEGEYGIPVITHCCLESHGQAAAWKGDNIEFWPSTQNVSGIGGDLGKNLSVPATNIHVNMQYIGGGFGSKFSADLWGVECAQLSKASGGKPVKLFLDRATELKIAGNRPSVYAHVKLAGKKDGTFTTWQSETWSTGGVGGGGLNADLFPYVFRNVANRRINHTAVSINTGSARAWRAPNNPQASYITCCAMEDLAAKMGIDAFTFFSKNADMTDKPEVYRAQLAKAAELIDWKKNWHARGEGKGTIRRGLGLGVAKWNGAGHDSHCQCSIHADGSVVVELGSQDLGTGTRTIITQVAAETLGLPMGAIKLNIGDNKYPVSAGSGGSTTVGGVSSSTRKATINALDKLFEAVAPSLGTEPDKLVAVDSRIQVKGNPAKSLTWQAACQKLGTKTISEVGHNDPRQAPREHLNTGGASGVQMAEVEVDTETGIVRMRKMVAVQDCGLVINPRTAESQVLGGCIMSVCSALMEEVIRDQQIGRALNADMEFYKLAGAADIGEIQVHLDINPEMDKRGVVGLGEPCAIAGVTAIANAVANAIGVRVPRVPVTPNRVLEALERKA